MGNSPSTLARDAERGLWDRPHELQVRSSTRADNLASLEAFGMELRVAAVPMKEDMKQNSGAMLRHYFITDGELVLEFGSREDGIAGGPVRVRTPVPDDYHKEMHGEKPFFKSRQVVERIAAVVGATNYCLLMRNSEHFARYIQGGGWTSRMTVDGGQVHELFKSEIPRMHKVQKQRLNQSPSELKAKREEFRALYPKERGFIRRKAERTSVLSADDVYYGFNILVLGPTGAGKSQLINQLFNATVVKSAGGSKSVTAEMSVVQGYAEIHGQERLVNIVDTIGFCDTNIDPVTLNNLIKQYVKANMVRVDKVVVVCGGRLQTTHSDAIKDFLRWLKYNQNKDCFGLVHTKCDGMEPDERHASLCEVCKTLGMTTSYQRWWDKATWLSPSSIMQKRSLQEQGQFSVTYNMAVSFPPSAPYSETKEDLLGFLDMVCTLPRKSLHPSFSEPGCNIL